jgi:hypothetical protein
MSVSSVGKEEPNSYLPTVGTLMSYCTVVCEVRFFFTYRRNVHVLLYCFVKFVSSLPTE